MSNRSVDHERRPPVKVIDVTSVVIHPREADAVDRPALPGGEEQPPGLRLRRRLVLAGLAGAGLVAGPMVAARRLLDGGSDGSTHDRDVAFRPADGDGFANRDESYASTGKIPASHEPQTVFDTAGEAAASTEVTVPTILATDDPAIHLLRRTTFGPTQGLAAEVHDRGIDAWLAEQLDVESIADEEADRAWAAFPLASMGPAEVRGSIQRQSPDAMADYAKATLTRQVWSRRQLYEVMVDFWANHLNVPVTAPAAWDVGPAYHNDVIRRHALGSFTDLLLAAMQHPAMLRYLNNADSKKEAVNENLGRELLELHTVGVASGYTEDDVRNSAYILTGRTAVSEHGAPDEGSFRYDPARHWTGAVRVLDFEHPNATAAGGMEVGDTYLRYLASHPATARSIAHKLAVRFVADSPPDSLVDRLATTYLDAGTAIPPMLDILFRSSEFWSAVGQKARRPLENFTAAARALGVRPGAGIPTAIQHFIVRLKTMGHRPLAWSAPNGYPDVYPAWRSAGGVLETWNTHRALVHGWHEGVGYTPPDQIAAGRPRTTVGEYVDSLCEVLCFQTFQDQHRQALIDFVGAAATAPTAQSDMGDSIHALVPLVLDAPYFALR